MKNYQIKITYSWGDEEPPIDCKTRAEAWQKMLNLITKEAEVAGQERDCEIGISFNRTEGVIVLRYTDDDETCTYEIVEK